MSDLERLERILRDLLKTNEQGFNVVTNSTGSRRLLQEIVDAIAEDRKANL